jgi:hypothetical protein
MWRAKNFLIKKSIDFFDNRTKYKQVFTKTKHSIEKKLSKRLQSSTFKQDCINRQKNHKWWFVEDWSTLEVCIFNETVVWFWKMCECKLRNCAYQCLYWCYGQPHLPWSDAIDLKLVEGKMHTFQTGPIEYVMTLRIARVKTRIVGRSEYAGSTFGASYNKRATWEQTVSRTLPVLNITLPVFNITQHSTLLTRNFTCIKYHFHSTLLTLGLIGWSHAYVFRV